MAIFATLENLPISLRYKTENYCFVIGPHFFRLLCLKLISYKNIGVVIKRKLSDLRYCDAYDGARHYHFRFTQGFNASSEYVYDCDTRVNQA